MRKEEKYVDKYEARGSLFIRALRSSTGPVVLRVPQD